jgi:hypothetical protein
VVLGLALIAVASVPALAAQAKLSWASWQDPEHYFNGVSGDATVPSGSKKLITTLPENDSDIKGNLEAYIKVGFQGGGSHPLLQIQSDKPSLLSCSPVSGGTANQTATLCTAKKQALRLLSGNTTVVLRVQPGKGQKILRWRFER